MMKFISILILTLVSYFSFAQEEKNKALQQSNDLIFEANEMVGEDFVDAEKEYRKAISKLPSNAVGPYNLGNAYYGSGLYDEALSRHIEAVETASTKAEKHRAYHNIGNTLMKQKACKEAVEAYKNALRNDPTDEESRYNFALAKECAEQQKDGEGDDENKDKDKEDENKDDEKKDEQDQKDTGDENEDNKDQEGDDDQKENEGDEKDDKDGKPKDEKDNNDNKDPKNQNKKQQQQPGQLSPQQIKNLLEAMNNQEKKVQEKINAKKAKGPKVKAEKDW